MSYKVHPGKSKGLTPELEEKLKTAIRQRIGEADQEDDEAQTEQLQAKRRERLTREAWADLSPNERAEFESHYGAMAMLTRLAAQARREVDEHWAAAEVARQDQTLQEWMQDPEQRVKYSDNYHQMLFDLAEQGKQRTQERQRARERRELEAEAFDDDLRRVWAGLDEDERKVYARLLDQQPTQLELIEKFKAERRNPIAGIDDRRTLYRMAAESGKPQRERWVEPLENIENVDDPHALYEMANKQMQESNQKGGTK